MTNGLKRFTVLLVLIAGLLICHKSVLAITVSPVVVDQEIAPGMQVNGKMLLVNDGQQRQTYYLSVQTFVAVGEEGEQQYLNENDVQGLPSWFVFKNQSYDVQPGKSVEIPYSILVPPDAEPGGHYATVFFTTNPNAEANGSAVGIAAKTGIVFLIKVSGNVKEQADLETFTVNQSVFSHLPAMMSLRIRNTGSVHFRPTGTLEIRNMWGGIVARVPANPKKGAVLPNSIRRLDTWWTKSTDIAQGGFWAGVTNEWRNFALGRYTATVDVKYGSQNTPLESKTVAFWVIPWRLGLIGLGIILMLLLIMTLYNRMIVSSAMKTHKKRH